MYTLWWCGINNDFDGAAECTGLAGAAAHRFTPYRFRFLALLPAASLSLQLSIMQAHVLEQALGSWRGLDLAYAAALSQAHLHACSCFVTASGLTSDTLLFSRLNALALLLLLLLLTLLTLLHNDKLCGD